MNIPLGEGAIVVGAPRSERAVAIETVRSFMDAMARHDAAAAGGFGQFQGLLHELDVRTRHLLHPRRGSRRRHSIAERHCRPALARIPAMPVRQVMVADRPV